MEPRSGKKYRPAGNYWLRSDLKPAERVLDWTDLQCLERACKGDAQAFRILVERHTASLYRVALGLVGNAADAEDVVQEAFLGAATSMHRFNNQASVKTWLTRIVVIQSARCHRSRKRRATSLDQLPTLPAFSGVEGRIGATEARIDVSAMLEQLAPEHRQVLVLRELQGMSYEEIASILEIPRGTVESRLHRARQSLKQRFAPQERTSPAASARESGAVGGNKSPHVTPLGATPSGTTPSGIEPPAKDEMPGGGESAQKNAASVEIVDSDAVAPDPVDSDETTRRNVESVDGDAEHVQSITEAIEPIANHGEPVSEVEKEGVKS
jgi:RNA polymerase sigma-70 factor, ECF subfamily